MFDTRPVSLYYPSVCLSVQILYFINHYAVPPSVLVVDGGDAAEMSNVKNEFISRDCSR